MSKRKAATESVSKGFGIDRGSDVPWNEKKSKVLSALKTLKAVGASAGVPAKAVAEACGLSRRDVRHYCYHGKSAGLTGVGSAEGTAGYVFYLTAKGAKAGPPDSAGPAGDKPVKAPKSKKPSRSRPAPPKDEEPAA